MATDQGEDGAFGFDGVAGHAAAGPQVWSITVNGHIGSDGVSCYTQHGTLVETLGEQLVRTQWGTYVPRRDGWYPTQADALDAGAAQIEAYGRRLIEQAAELRARALVQREGL